MPHSETRFTIFRPIEKAMTVLRLQVGITELKAVVVHVGIVSYPSSHTHTHTNTHTYTHRQSTLPMGGIKHQKV